MCQQSAGLVARALEMAGVATVGLFWMPGAARAVLPPRALITGFSRGKALGEAQDADTHRAVLREAIGMLRQEAPLMRQR